MSNLGPVGICSIFFFLYFSFSISSWHILLPYSIVSTDIDYLKVTISDSSKSIRLRILFTQTKFAELISRRYQNISLMFFNHSKYWQLSIMFMWNIGKISVTILLPVHLMLHLLLLTSNVFIYLPNSDILTSV